MEYRGEKYGRYLMHCLKNDSFVDLKNAFANLGDSIQALAMDSIYEQIGIDQDDIQYIKRDFANEYTGTKTKIPFYSEFARVNLSNRLPMSKDINVRMLLSAVFYDSFEELSKIYPDCYSTIKSWEPVSARDEVTADYLNKCGVETYLTGCFTICFPKRKTTPQTPKVFFVDIPQSLEAYIPDHLKSNCEYITHGVPIQEYPISEKENQRLEDISRSILKKYKDEATLVVTSRLHAAIPCIALGVPVIFACTNVDFRFAWVEKLFHPYQYEEFGQIDWNPKTIDVEDVKQKILLMIKNALIGNSYVEEMKWLDSFYRDRERVEPYMHFHTIIREIGKLHPDNSKFKYLIWGAGFHCGYALNLMKESYPEAVPVIVVDRYKKGTVDGVAIVEPDMIPEISFDHMIITTVHGLNDALEWRDKNFPDMPYSLITSDQKS